MSQGTESTTYRRAKELEAKRLGLAPPASPPRGPSKPLSPEYRLALMRQAQRLNLPAPIFDRDGREIAPAAGRREADAFLQGEGSTGFKREEPPTGAPLSAPAPVAAAAKPLSAFDQRVLYHADCRKFGGVHERMPDGTTWSPEVSRSNWEK
jgi:hypothetical protein